MADFKTNAYFEISIGDVPAGRIVFKLYEDTPITSKNFSTICANEGHARKGNPTYTGTIFHRIIPNFMLQGGDNTRFNGTGGSSIYGEKFRDEAAALKKKHDRPFLLSMANAGPNTNGSQFFITTVVCEWLDGKHGVFGEVVEGKELVKKIESLGSNSGAPRSQVTVTKSGVF